MFAGYELCRLDAQSGGVGSGATHTLLWSGNLHLLAHAVPLQDARTLVVYSVAGSKGDSEGFDFSVRLPLMFSFLCTRTHHDRKAIAVPQGLPDGIDQLQLRVTADKVQLAAKSAACA